MKLKTTKLFFETMVLYTVFASSLVLASTKQHHPYNYNLPAKLTQLEWGDIKKRINVNKTNSNIDQNLKIKQSSYLKSSNTQFGDVFGYAIDIYGDTMVVGAFGEDGGSSGVNGDESDDSIENSGAAYVFVKIDGEWVQEAYLKASNTGEADNFGNDVAIFGDVIVVTAIWEDSSARGVNGDEGNNDAVESGAAYVFTRINGTWSQTAYLKASNSGTKDAFGVSVDISLDTIVVGAPFEDSNATGINGNENNNSSFGSGAAYIFKNTSGVWRQEAYLKAPDQAGLADRSNFGTSVSIYMDTVVIGAPNAEFDNSGSVYLFKKSNDGWQQEAYLRPNFPSINQHFGNSVSISEDTIAIGSMDHDSNSIGINGDEINRDARKSGAAYIFQKSTSNNWTQQAFLKASNTNSNDQFGTRVAIHKDTVVVSAVLEDSGSTGINGDESNNLSESSGASYVFNRTNGVWTQSFYVKASNSESGDQFGNSVAISDNTIAVGSWLEDSNATGVMGDDSDNTLEDSGAVYVFEPKGFAMQPGHSALWYNPEQNGHGINVYMLEDNRIIVIWYVYDDQGNQVWLLGLGTHDGVKATLDVTIHNGAMFPPNFDTNDVNTVSWGIFELNFSDCNTGLFKWIPLSENGFTAGETKVIRLINTLGLTCLDADAGTKTAQVLKNEEPALKQGDFGLQAGHSALWYNLEQSGHGINVYMLEDNRITVIWYVYDDQGNQVWLLGLGTHDGVKAILDVTIHSGAMFPPNFNAIDVNTMTWGTFELEFSGCNDGLFKWSPIADNGFTAGETSMVRLNNTLGLSCTE